MQSMMDLGGEKVASSIPIRSITTRRLNNKQFGGQYSLGCFIISPLPIFVMGTHYPDGILEADHEFDIIF